MNGAPLELQHGAPLRLIVPGWYGMASVKWPGVYIGFPDKVPFGAAMNEALTFKMGQTHVPKYHRALLKRIEAGEIDPSFVITHTIPLEEGPAAYETFRDKEDGCIKVVLKPQMRAAA